MIVVILALAMYEGFTNFPGGLDKSREDELRDEDYMPGCVPDPVTGECNRLPYARMNFFTGTFYYALAMFIILVTAAKVSEEGQKIVTRSVPFQYFQLGGAGSST